VIEIVMLSANRFFYAFKDNLP